VSCAWGMGSLLTKSLEAAELKAAIHEAAAEVTSSLSVPDRIEEKLAALRRNSRRWDCQRISRWGSSHRRIRLYQRCSD